MVVKKDVMRVLHEQRFLPRHSASQDDQRVSRLAQFSQCRSDFALAERQIQHRLRIAWIYRSKLLIDIQRSTVLRECSTKMLGAHQNITDLLMRKRPVPSCLNVFPIRGTERFEQAEFLPEMSQSGGKLAPRHER